MQELSPWLTPALLVAIFAWLRVDLRELRVDIREPSRRIDALAGDVNKRFDGVDQRF